MGYYTYFGLNIVEGFDSEVDYEKEIGELSGYGSVSGDSYKWYNHEEDMKTYSERYPETVFALDGNGEDNEDMWIKYFKNGKMQTAKAVIRFEKYDESKLK